MLYLPNLGAQAMPETSELEKRIIKAEQLGQAWAKLHEKHLQLDEDKKNYLASLMNDIDDGEMSELKLECKARATPQFRDYIRGLCIAKGEELRARVRYENAVAYWEAGRSKESTERTKMQMLRDVP